MTLQEQRIAILGAGTSGIAAARLALAGGAAWVGVYDSGDPEKLSETGQTLQNEGIEVCFGDSALEAPEGIDLVVISPGIDAGWEIARNFADTGAPLIGEIEFAWRQCQCPVVAITGTNGKTTTTELTARVLNAAGVKSVAAGNYGLAFCEVMRSGEEYGAIALEVSSFQLETIESFRPQVAVWMNFAADHLDRYDSLEDYKAAKLRIFENQEADDWAVVNAAENPGSFKARKRSFSAFGAEAYYDYLDGWIRRSGEPVLNYSEVLLHGLHNAENVMASLAAVESLGYDPISDAVLEAVRTYQPPRHRCEPVGEIGGRLFINDSKATNLHALSSSLRGQESPVVLIAGGKQKGLDYSEMLPILPKSVSHAVCIGEIGEEIADVWGETISTEVAASLEEAVEKAAGAAGAGQTILFSPGTSSFDMFSGYVERGDAFRSAVERLAG